LQILCHIYDFIEYSLLTSIANEIKPRGLVKKASCYIQWQNFGSHGARLKNNINKNWLKLLQNITNEINKQFDRPLQIWYGLPDREILWENEGLFIYNSFQLLSMKMNYTTEVIFLQLG